MYVVHFHHGVGQYEGMVKRAIGGVERDYLLHRLQGRRQALRPVRPDRHAAPVRGRRGAVPAPPRRLGLRQGQEPGALRRPRDRPGAGGPLPEAGDGPGLRLQHRHAVAGRDGGCLRVRRDPRPAAGDRGDQGRHGGTGTPWTVSSVATSASARPRWPCGRRSRRSRTASRWRCSSPPPCWPASTCQTFAERFANYPVRVETLCRFLTPAETRAVTDGLASGEVDIVIGTHHLLAAVRMSSSRTSGCWLSTRSSASGLPTKRRSKS